MFQVLVPGVIIMLVGLTWQRMGVLVLQQADSVRQQDTQQECCREPKAIVSMKLDLREQVTQGARSLAALITGARPRATARE